MAARARCLGVPVQTHAEPGGSLGIDLEALESHTCRESREVDGPYARFSESDGHFHSPGCAPENTGNCHALSGRHVEDHIYARLYNGEERIPSLKQLDRTNIVIHIDSFAKVAFPGLRVGWIVAPPTAVERLRLVKQTTGPAHRPTRPSDARRIYPPRDVAKHLSKMRKVYASRLRAVDEALRKHMPEGTAGPCPKAACAYGSNSRLALTLASY